MKKILLTFVLCGLVGVAFAQTNFGVTAGLNVSNETVKAGSLTLTPDWKAGFQAGVFMDYALTPQISLIPELLFTQRGMKMKEMFGEKIDASLTLNYIQLPVNVAYKFDLGNEQCFFPFVGPYVGYAISGKDKMGNESENIKFGSGEEETKPLDFGLNLGIGYQFEKIIFKLQYNLGLADLSNVPNVTCKNTNVALTVGYMF